MAKWRNMCLSCSKQWISFNLNCSQYDCQFTWAHSKCAHDDKCTLLWSYSWCTCLELQLTRGVSERKQTTHFGKYTNRTKHIAMMAGNVGCTSSAPSILEWFELRLVYHALPAFFLRGLRLFAELLRFIPRFLRIYFGLPNKKWQHFKKEVNHWSISIKYCVYKRSQNWPKNHFDHFAFKALPPLTWPAAMAQ